MLLQPLQDALLFAGALVWHGRILRVRRHEVQRRVTLHTQSSSQQQGEVRDRGGVNSTEVRD